MGGMQRRRLKSGCDRLGRKRNQHLTGQKPQLCKENNTTEVNWVGPETPSRQGESKRLLLCESGMTVWEGLRVLEMIELFLEARAL